MIVTNANWVPEVVSVMTTIELALIFNSHRNKNAVVRRTCNKLKHRLSNEMQMILHKWSRAHNSHDLYDTFMTKAGL